MKRYYTRFNPLQGLLLGSHKYTALTVVALILALVALPLTGWGQTTHSWGSSSTNSGTSGYANPFGRYYGYEYRVYLYPPNTMSNVSGNITKLEFLPNEGLNYSGGQIDVWMKTTTSITSLSSSTTFATYKSNATKVYTSSSSPSYTAGNYVSIPLSTPIAYNYNNNEYLMVLVRSVASDPSSGDANTYFYYYNPSGASDNTWYARNDSSDPGESGTSWDAHSTGAYLPVIRVTYTTPHTLTMAVSPSGAGTATAGSSSLAQGSTTTITATANSGYTFSNWTVSGTGASVASSTSASTTFTMGSTNATVTANFVSSSYCTPSYSYTGDYIVTFSTTGGTTNINNNSNAQGSGGYSNFYNDYSASISAGSSLGFTVHNNYSTSTSTSYAYKYAIWVDWNNDYDFSDSGETMASQTTSINGDWTGSFTIPSGTAAGDYRMRVEMLYGSNNNLDPCISASYGEVEDYKLTVAPANYTLTMAVSPAGAGTATAGSSSLAQGSTTTITATANSGYTFSNWTVSGTGASVASSTSASTTFTMGSANATVTANFVVDANCDYYENFENISGASSSYDSGGTLPANWDRIYGGTVYNASATTPANMPHVHNGSTPGLPSTGYYLGFYSNTNNSSSYAIMPAVASGTAVNHLSFKYKLESANYGALRYGAQVQIASAKIAEI